jgi:hypothetical protein
VTCSVKKNLIASRNQKARGKGSRRNECDDNLSIASGIDLRPFQADRYLVLLTLLWFFSVLFGKIYEVEVLIVHWKGLTVRLGASLDVFEAPRVVL